MKNKSVYHRLVSLSAIAVFSGASSAIITATANEIAVAKANFSLEGVVTFRSGEEANSTAIAATPYGIAFEIHVFRPYYVDHLSRTLYTISGDLSSDEIEFWPPAIALDGAVPHGDWDLLETEKGAKQWTYRGERVYRHVDDNKIGDHLGDPSFVEQPRLQVGGARANKPPPPKPLDIRGKALVYEGMSLDTPAGLTHAEVPDAAGRSIVTSDGKTVYIRRPEGAHVVCTTLCDWEPVRAPAIARSIGDFTVVLGEQGVNQWAFQGNLLYTYSKDVDAGQARGADVNSDWLPALIERFYYPDGVEIRNVPGAGTIMNVNGKTVYQRDRLYGQQGGRKARKGFPTGPYSGREIGTRGCSEVCEKEFEPVLAPDGAMSNDYWTVLTRSDGRKQWAYKGFALYSYTNDITPGDINGNDVTEIYDLATYHGPYRNLLLEGIDFSTETISNALFWRVVYP